MGKITTIFLFQDNVIIKSKIKPLKQMTSPNETKIKFLESHISSADKRFPEKTKSEGRVKLALSIPGLSWPRNHSWAWHPPDGQYLPRLQEAVRDDTINLYHGAVYDNAAINNISILLQ